MSGISGRHRATALLAALHASQSAPDGSDVAKAARRMQVAAQLAEDSPSGDNAATLSALVEQLEARVQGSAGSCTIMIVEDDRLTAQIHADALAIGEITVVVARSSGEASALLRQHDVSIILLDLVLPDADGRDILIALRATAATRSIPIIVITARVDPATQAECYALGADVLLVKPVDPDVLVALVASQLDHAEELRTAGRIDRLTGLANRAALTDTMERLAPLAQRTRTPLSVAMVDLDYFKAINDSYGHDIGDLVLQRTAHSIVAALRSSDLAARWGGEEFCVLLPDTTPSGAARALTKALEAVRELDFEAKGEAFRVTFSAGVAAVLPRGTLEQALKHADELLYLAKKSGRNRVFSVDDEADPPRPRVLLVEDDERVSQLVQILLEREGFEVVPRSDGETALHAAEAEYFALAIVDVDVPVINGLDLIQRLRATPACAKLPVIVVTGSTDEEDIVRGFELGANDYVTKPFFSRELVARVNRLVPRK